MNQFNKKNIINEEVLKITERGLEITYLDSNYILIQLENLDSNIIKYLSNQNFSLIQLFQYKLNNKNIKDFILNEPEKFGQIILHNYIYYNWEMEKENKNMIGKTDRYDLYLNHLENFISLIEIKHYNLIKNSNDKNYQNFVMNTRKQLNDYITNNQKNMNHSEHYFGLIILDCNYLFNNPNIITYLSDYLTGLYNPEKEFIIQENYLINPEQTHSYINKEEMYKNNLVDTMGILSILEIDKKDFTKIEDSNHNIKQISSATLPSKLSLLETDTNVRDLHDNSVNIIKKSIIKDIKEEGVENYFARTTGTGDKHISIKGKPLIYDFKLNYLLVGFNIDEFNGQHSTTAYADIEKNQEEIILEILNSDDYSEEFNLNIKKFLDDQLLIPIKIFPYNTRKELDKIKENSNFSVGKPELKKSKYIPLIKHINRLLFTIDNTLQIDHPKKRELSNILNTIKYDYFFGYLSRFIYAYRKSFKQEQLSLDGIKIRTKQINETLDKKIMELFYKESKKFENYRDFNRKTRTYQESNLNMLIKQENYLIKAYNGELTENEESNIVNNKIKIGRVLVNIDDISVEQAYEYKKEYEKIKENRENSLNFNQEMVTLFYLTLKKFYESYDINSNKSNKETIFFNVFYFTMKHFFKTYSHLKKPEELINRINLFDFEETIYHYRIIFSFIEKMPEHNLKELGILNSPKDYKIDDENIEKLFHDNNIDIDKKADHIIKNILNFFSS